jgi:N-dimethylarginine dimethylaminohydrolase
MEATYLMCPPDFFGVDYVINPWMEGHIGDVNRGRAHEQWLALRAILEGPFEARVQTVEPVEGLPDMVFTANAGLVYDRIFVPARFRFQERRGEEVPFESWFAGNRFDQITVNGFNEGAGDMLFLTSDGESTLFAAFGFRSDRSTHAAIAEKLGVKVETLELVNPRFYHLDTCFCPLPGGNVIWHPSAFSEGSVQIVKSLIPEANRYEAMDIDATHFACNAVGVPGHVVMNDCSVEMEEWLNGKSFEVHRTPLDEFMKAGGGAKCLTLRVDSGLV